MCFLLSISSTNQYKLFKVKKFFPIKQSKLYYFHTLQKASNALQLSSVPGFYFTGIVLV